MIRRKQHVQHRQTHGRRAASRRRPNSRLTPAARGSSRRGTTTSAAQRRERAAESTRLREYLVEQLKARDALHSEALERALLRVPREVFLPDIAEREGLERIYADEAIVTKRSSQGAAISSSSAPSMMAIMLEQLDLRPGLRVLEIGAGTGYNAALLAELVGDPAATLTVEHRTGPWSSKAATTSPTRAMARSPFSAPMASRAHPAWPPLTASS